MGHVQASRLIPAPIDEVYRYMADLQNLANDLSAHFCLKFADPHQPLKEQAEVEAYLTRYGINVHIVARIEEIIPNQKISYRLTRGLLRSWRHVQVFKEHGKATTLVSDLVDFRMPMGMFGALFDDVWMRREVEAVLHSRLAKIEHHFATTTSFTHA